MKIKMLIGFFLITTSIFAAYLTNIEQELIQPDGTVLKCFASGDEFFNWLHDENNYTIIRDTHTGFYVYAKLEGNVLMPTNYIPGIHNPADYALEPGVNVLPDDLWERRDEFNAILDQLHNRVSTTGIINNLVVFIRFSDQTEFEEPFSLYDNMFNLQDSNSMYEYYWEVSDEQLEIFSHSYPEPNGNVVVSYQDSHPRDYYLVYDPVTNPIGYQNSTQRTQREHTLLMNAINYIAPQVPPTLDIDNDNDGFVDNVCFIIKGAAAGWADLLWPHMWVLYSYNVYINGVQVWAYNFQLSNSLQSSGVGVLCHEMFHSLGAPDLYHYTSNGIDPAGSWDLMCACPNPPEHMTAYMKYKYGMWFNELPEISASGIYSLDPLANSPYSCYKIPSPNSNTEFFMVEYRKEEGIFEPSVPGTGLIVYRIDPTINGNASGPPDELYIYRPNGTLTVNGNINQAHFSADVGRTEINDNTNPSCFLQNGSPGGLFIHDIGYAGDTIAFTLETGLIAMFESNVQTGPSNLGVQFYNTSYPQSGIIAYAWDFDGDGVYDNYDENPFHYYNEIGTYDVTLQITDGYEIVETTVEDFITVTDASSISGNLSGIWTEEFEPYTIVDDVQVSEDDKLYILPGVDIFIENNARFSVNGMLQADASSAATIQFDSVTDWKGMKFSNTQEDNKLINCKFSNATETAVGIENYSNLEITDCVFYNNSSTAKGAAIDAQSSDDVSIENNIIANNQSSTNTGGIRCVASSLQIRNNIIVNNTGNYGSLVFQMDSDVNLINNTIANNSSSISEIFIFNSDITVMNDILVTDATVFNNIGGSTDVTYSCISGGYAGTGNINADPLFVNPSSGNGTAYNGLIASWWLQDTSPCIDAGNPDPVFNDPDGTRNDMGAYGGPNSMVPTGYSDEEVITPISSSISVYPNPFNPETNISLTLKISDADKPVTLQIYNMRGQLVKNLLQNEISTSANYIWEGTNNSDKKVSSGLYFVKMKTSSDITAKKMILLK